MGKHLGDKLIDYAWGMMSAQERAQADAHLAGCAECRAELAGHQTLVSQMATTIPAMLPAAPPRVRAGWPAIAARISYLRTSAPTARHGSPGLAAVGVAVSVAVLLAVTVTLHAWLELGRPPLTATAFYPSSTPTASVTYSPECPSPAATPVASLMQAAPIQAPRPLPAMTARP
jgi:anti-sigma factor RsiW